LAIIPASVSGLVCASMIAAKASSDADDAGAAFGGLHSRDRQARPITSS